MIDFMFVSLIVILILLAIAIHYKILFLGLLSTLGLIMLGFVGIIQGWVGYKNDLTEAVSIVIMLSGFYIFLSGTIDEMG